MDWNKSESLARWEIYTKQLGDFIVAYASVEDLLNLLVRFYYKIDEITANVILGRLRYDTATEHLQRLQNIGRMPADDEHEISYIKNQLGQITRLRNDLLHNPPLSVTEEAFITSAERWDYHTIKTRVHHIGENTLPNAGEDLYIIVLLIGRLLNSDKREAIEKTLRQFYGGVHPPWRYKPPAPIDPSPERQPSRRERRNRRGSSPA